MLVKNILFLVMEIVIYDRKVLLRFLNIIIWFLKRRVFINCYYYLFVFIFVKNRDYC